ncbi:MAG: DMT family transporter [Alphaproteobacteria bacterium]|nr:DMT family transporter [Alphaproteobacteria bacterium]
MPLRYWGLLLFLGAVWGGSFMFNAILIREIDPLWVSAGRVIIGASICWVYLLATRRKLPVEPMIYLQLLLLGIVNYAIPFALFPYAEEHVPSGIVGVINGLTPMSTVIVSQFWPGGEKAVWNKVAGVAIGFAGAVILASPSFAESGAAEIPALLAALAATFCYAFSLNYARRFRAIDSASVATLSLTGAAIASTPFALTMAGAPVIALPETWWALIGIGTLSTSFSMLLLYWLLPRVGATNVALNTFITPISALILGYFILSESLMPVHFFGIAVIFLGLVAIDGRVLKLLRPRRPVIEG